MELLGFCLLILVGMLAVPFLDRVPAFKPVTSWLMLKANRIFLFVVLLLATFSITYVVLHILSVYGHGGPNSEGAIAFLIGYWVPTDKSLHIALLTDMIAGSAFLFAAFAAVQQSISRERLGAELLKKQGFSVQAIKEPGVDDLIEMHKHFKGAISLTIFGGSCDWIPDNPDLKKVITKLAGKRRLQLISFRGENVVAQQFEAKNESKLFESLRSSYVFNSGFPEHMCTLITKPPSRLEVLFMSPPDSEGHIFNVSLLESRPQSEQLLHILKDLIEKGWGKPGDNATADSGARNP